MRIAERTISFLAKTITGDNDISFYRSGPELVDFFNEIGFNDVYGQGFPSRWFYTEEKIRELNDTDDLIKVFKLLLDPRNYIDNEDMLDEMVLKLNKYLKFDNYEVIKDGDYYKIKDLKSNTINFSKEVSKLSHEFIDEQVEKIEKKIVSKDYDGAITNARSLIEAILVEIEKKLDSNYPDYDGNLIKLYRRVQKLINLDPSRKDIEDCLKQVLGGLNSIINGLAGIRNKMSDSHVRSYKPSKHHALLVVNSAKTFVNFILDTYKYQNL